MKTYIHITYGLSRSHIYTQSYICTYTCITCVSLGDREERERGNVMKTDFYNDLSLSIHTVIVFQHKNTSYTVPNKQGNLSAKLLEIK